MEIAVTSATYPIKCDDFAPRRSTPTPSFLEPVHSEKFEINHASTATDQQYFLTFLSFGIWVKKVTLREFLKSECLLESELHV